MIAEAAAAGTHTAALKQPALLPDTATRKLASEFSPSSALQDLLKSIEAPRLEPYDDQTSKKISDWVQGATIGYGHLIKKSDWAKYKDGMTAADAAKLFDDDLQPFVVIVQSSITVKVTQNEFDAMVMLAFNIGSVFSTSSVAKLVNDPGAKTSYKNLESAWKAWNKAQGKEMKGLNNRRQCEWDIYKRAIYTRW